MALCGHTHRSGVSAGSSSGECGLVVCVCGGVSAGSRELVSGAKRGVSEAGSLLHCVSCVDNNTSESCYR